MCKGEDVRDFEWFLTENLTTIDGISSVDSSVSLRCVKQNELRSWLLTISQPASVV